MYTRDASTKELVKELFRRTLCGIGLHDWSYGWSERKDPATGRSVIGDCTKSCMCCRKRGKADPRKIMKLAHKEG